MARNRRRDRNKRVLCHRGGHTQGVVSLVLKSPYPSGDGAICSRRPDKGDRSKSGAGRRVGLGGVVWRGGENGWGGGDNFSMAGRQRDAVIKPDQHS